MAFVATDSQVHKPKVDFCALEVIITDLLLAIGEDPARPGLVETPRRVARWWSEFIDYSPGKISTSFEHVNNGQMVIVSGMRFWSLCEHHLLPFWVDISIGYIPNEKVLGLSKFARVAKKHARKLQIQERLVSEILEEIQHLSGSDDVFVSGSGQHLCMVMRGIETPGIMTTVKGSGYFKDDPEKWAKFGRVGDG